MYYPYFRGKQYELIAIRESVPTLAEKGFVPIIEPVKKRLSGLHKTLDQLCGKEARVILIMNPRVGDHRHDNSDLTNFIRENYHDERRLICGLLLTEETSTDEAVRSCNEFDKEIALIHNGYLHAEELSREIIGLENINAHIFIEDRCGKLYQSHFRDHPRRILVRDGFNKTRNRDYPPAEFFSELHATYNLEGMNGFGDFLIVGSKYFERGGPAYAVTIHLTYIDSKRNNEMHVRHFTSDRQDTPVDPAGKFAEALAKLIAALDEVDNNIPETDAVTEFRNLHREGHFPGLGYVKKLSMLHHIETLTRFFS
ncbi:MAG: sce7725 family protein [Bacteroidetes bacterium]|nr:sce7725 family protein [Bacteroidota bacterium]